MSVKLKISDIFSYFKEDFKNTKIYNAFQVWKLNSLDEFILSFEKQDVATNIKNSKIFGNIAKKITKQILEEDICFYDYETEKYLSDKEILEYVKQNDNLYNKFKLLYENIKKRNYWKLNTPLITSKYDINLEKFKSDYQRLYFLYLFLFKNKPLTVRDIENKKKIKLNKKDLNEFEIQELEKIFYILYRKVKKRKKYLNTKLVKDISKIIIDEKDIKVE